MKKTKACPVCKKETNIESAQDFLPFCSRLCQNKDLLSWMNEGYKIPIESDSDDDDLLRVELDDDDH